MTLELAIFLISSGPLTLGLIKLYEKLGWLDGTPRHHSLEPLILATPPICGASELDHDYGSNNNTMHNLTFSRKPRR